MTTFSSIAGTESDPLAPLISSLFKRMIDNPIAITEGSTGAPKIDPIAAMAHGGVEDAVGTYMFAIYNNSTNTTKNFGDTLSGSNLDPVGMSADTGLADFHVGVDKFTISSTVPSGTWRCMGHAINDTTGRRGVSLWLRIS